MAEERRQRFEQFFKDADVDGSGTLTLDELVNQLKKNGYRGTDRSLKVI